MPELSTIALIHNRYQHPGGEDVAVATDHALLESHGHTVVRHDADNRDLEHIGPLAAARLTLWNAQSKRDLRALFERTRPAVAHFHNTFPLISPSAYSAAREAGVAVVQTLHNYRLLCPNALLFRDGHVCEDCLNKRVKWPAVLHACYRGSRPASAATAAMLALHSARGTWRDSVDVYVALSAFARGKFVDGGLPPERIVVRPNFLADDPGKGEHLGGYALFVGRLSPEKGVETLLAAWRALSTPRPLRIVGDGPLEASLMASLEGRAPNVELLGQRPRHEVLALMRDAALLVFPSVCYENFPMTIAEAFATGLPVVASRLGAAAEIVADGVTGKHFAAGDSGALAQVVDWAFEHPHELAALGDAARREYETKYTARAAYAALTSIYDAALRGSSRRT